MIFIDANKKLKNIGKIELTMSFFLTKSKRDEYWYSIEKTDLISYLSGLMKTASLLIFSNNKKAKEVINIICRNPMKYINIEFGGLSGNCIIYFYIKWTH